MTTCAAGRWTLTIETPLSGKINIRFASESAARAYRDELIEKNQELDEDVYQFEGSRPTYTVWYDPAANPSVNIPNISTGTNTFRSCIASPDAYDPSDY